MGQTQSTITLEQQHEKLLALKLLEDMKEAPMIKRLILEKEKEKEEEKPDILEVEKFAQIIDNIIKNEITNFKLDPNNNDLYIFYPIYLDWWAHIKYPYFRNYYSISHKYRDEFCASIAQKLKVDYHYDLLRLDIDHFLHIKLKPKPKNP